MATSNLDLNPDAASFEDFGDEIVVIHNDSGVFYSLKGRAMAVWRALADGLDAAGLDAGLRPTSPEEADTVQRMLAEFESNGIVVPSVSPSCTVPDLAGSGLGPARFESNSDFDDLIRLDPIHDVADSGWPHRKDESR
jgi:hypothetical protein